MLYKTIVQELLQQRTELHEHLRTTRTLLPTLDRLATQLKTSHETWKEILSKENGSRGGRGGRDSTQIASEALEMALQELESRLESIRPTDDPEAP